jgi:hypothetical protein
MDEDYFVSLPRIAIPPPAERRSRRARRLPPPDDLGRRGVPVELSPHWLTGLRLIGRLVYFAGMLLLPFAGLFVLWFFLDTFW